MTTNTKSMNSIELKTKLQQGDPDAFTTLFKRVYPRLLGYCRLFVKDVEQSKDLVQECFMQIWEGHAKIDQNKSIESLLFIALRHKCYAYLKKERLNTVQIQYDDLSVNELQYLYQLDFTQKEELSLEEQLINSLQSAIDHLPPKRKKVFILAKIDGMQQKVIAEQLGISVKAVEKHLHEAKKQLHNKLHLEYPSLIIVINLLLESF
jgi:RNA polymerase sigma-70 factor (ECF subfamily)